jgi:hypothetical protein
MRIIFNGVMSKVEDFPDVPVITEEKISSAIPSEAIQEFIRGPQRNVRTILGMNRRTFGLTVGTTVAAVSAYIALPRGQKNMQQASMLAVPDASPEQDRRLLQPLSRIVYDNEGLVRAVEGNGWIWERGMILPDIRVTELTGKGGHILAFESADPKHNPQPKIALSTVPGRTFGFVEHAGRAGYIVASGAASNVLELAPDSLTEFTDAICRAEGLSAGKIEMFSDEVLGVQNHELQVLARAEARRKAKPGEGFAHAAAVLLDIAMRIRDARNTRNITATNVDELLGALEQHEPLFAVVPQELKEALRTKRLTRAMIRNVPAPGMYLCFPSTNTGEAQDYVDLSV